MPIEQRVVSAPKIGAGKIGAKQAAPPPAAAEPEKKKRGRLGKKKLLVVGAALLVVVVAAAAAYFFVLAPKGSSAGKQAAPQPTIPVAVVDLDSHSLNLADGHYLRLGIALELSKKSTIDATPALDAAITVFSGRTVAEVTDPATREQLRAELLAKCQELFGKDLVMGVKFSDYVTQ